MSSYPSITSPTKVAITECVCHAEHQIIVNSGNKDSLALVEGQFISFKSPAGYGLHGGTTVEKQHTDIISSAPPSLIFTILLNGKLSFGYDDLHFNLDAKIAPTILMVNLKKQAGFHRKICKGNHVTKLNIMITPDWLKSRVTHGDNHQISLFIEQHKSCCTLEVNDTILQLVISLLQLSSEAGFHHSLIKESLCQQLLSSLFVQFSLHKPNSSPILASSTSSQLYFDDIAVIIDFLEQNLYQDLDLALIANKAAMSISTLQRKFKKELGLTVLGYVRFRRLELAKIALQSQFVTVTEAAYEAGYLHPSNFTSAFKKAFGVSPSELIANQ